MPQKKQDKLKKSIDDYITSFEQSDNIETLRQVIACHPPMGVIGLKEGKKKLDSWFGKKLYSLGKIIKKLSVLHDVDNFGFSVGLGYEIEAKKGKINIGSYLIHLLLVLEAKEREIKHKNQEVLEAKKIYLDMEDAIRQLINNDLIPEKIKEKFYKFYWLIHDEEET